METDNRDQLQAKEQLPSTSSTSQQKSLSDDDYVRIQSKMLSTCRNREDCHFGNYKTLKELNKEKGLKVGQGMVATYLYLLNVATNYKVKLSDLQVKLLSETIYDSFFYLRETEVMLFFNDLIKYVSSDEFFGALEPNTISEKLTKWVRMTRSAAIKRHDDILDTQRKEEEKPYHITWEEFCSQNGNNSSDSPIGRILSGFGKSKAPRDTQESITESAQALINNKWGYDDDTMMNARRSFACRYGYSPEDYLRKEEKYV